MTYTFKWLAREICRREGLKKSLTIADVSEVLRVLVDIEHESGLQVSGFFEAQALRRALREHRKDKAKPKKRKARK